MPRRLHVRRLAATTVPTMSNFGAYRMRVEVTEAEGDDIDKFIFLYRRGSYDPTINDTCDTFVAIASPAQFSHHPPKTPNVNVGWPYFRLDYVEIDFVSSTQADQAWTSMKKDIHRLLCAFEQLSNLLLVDDQWYPNEEGDLSDGCCA